MALIKNNQQSETSEAFASPRKNYNRDEDTSLNLHTRPAPCT